MDLSIGEVAERAGLAASALRFYEKEGLIHSDRSEGGQRRYHRDVLRLVAFIRAAQRVGLTLDEIRGALAHAARTSHTDRGRLDASVARLAAAARPSHRGDAAVT